MSERFTKLKEFSALVKLELRKHRMMFWGLGSVYALIIIAATVTAKISPQKYGDLPNAASLFVFIVGTPLSALIFGGAIGAATRQEWRSDEDLPVSSERRAFAAYTAAAILQLLLTMIILGCSIRSDATGPVSYFSTDAIIVLLLISGAIVAGVIPVAWTFLTGWLVQSTAMAAALALIINIGTIAAIAFSIIMSLLTFDYYSNIWIWAILASFIWSLLGIWYFARVSGRSVKFTAARRTTAALILALPTLSGLIALACGVYVLENSVQLTQIWSNPYTDLSPDAMKRFDGVVVETAASTMQKGIYFVKPDGTRTELLERKGWLFSGKDTWHGIQDYSFSEDGTIWMLYHNADQFVNLYNGLPDGKLKLVHSIFTSGYWHHLAKTESGMALVKTIPSKSSPAKNAKAPNKTYKSLFTSLPLKETPQWKTPNINSTFRYGLIQTQTISKDENTCSVSGELTKGKRHTWRLNNGKPCRFFNSAGIMRLEKGWAFGIDVETKDGKAATALLREDGSTSMIWHGPKKALEYEHKCAGGGFYIVNWERIYKASAFSKIYSLSTDGTENPPVSIIAGEILRIRPGLIWYLNSDSEKETVDFVKYDINAGKNIFSIRLKYSSHLVLQPCPSGIFEVSYNKIRFYDWDGNSRKI